MLIKKNNCLRRFFLLAIEISRVLFFLSFSESSLNLQYQLHNETFHENLIILLGEVLLQSENKKIA